MRQQPLVDDNEEEMPPRPAGPARSIPGKPNLLTKMNKRPQRGMGWKGDTKGLGEAQSRCSFREHAHADKACEDAVCRMRGRTCVC